MIEEDASGNTMCTLRSAFGDVRIGGMAASLRLHSFYDEISLN